MPSKGSEQPPSRLPLYVGLALVILGWVAIGVGWYQSAQQELETGQIPYLISGGFGGFGLVLMGIIAVLVDVVRQAEYKLRLSATELHGRMEELAETFVANQTRRTRPARSPDGRVTGARRRSSDGRTASPRRRKASPRTAGPRGKAKA